MYFDEAYCADHPWSRRAHGRALLSALSGPAYPAWTLAGAWRLLPRRAPAEGTGILPQLARRHILLMLADTGAAVLAAQEYALLGRLMPGIASRRRPRWRCATSSAALRSTACRPAASRR